MFTKASLFRPLSQLSSRFASTLVLVEHNGGKISSGTYSALSASSKIGGDVTAFVGGSSSDSVAKEVAKIPGVKNVLVSKDAALDSGLPEAYSKALIAAQKAKNFSHIMACHSAFGKNIMPRVAALLDVSQLSDVLEIKSEDTFRRPLYAGNAIATVQTSESVKVVTVRQTAFQKPEGSAGDAKIEEFGEKVQHDGSSELVESILTKSDRPELASAVKVIAGGRALKSGENFKILYDLADKIGAAVGASRAAVDAGYVPNDMQIGQTGKTVAPGLYIAVGISGAIQHLAGMKDSKVIVCINKDPEAPIFQVADYGLVGDLFKVVPEMTEKL